MHEETRRFVITCEGPGLDYTARANLHRAGIWIVDEGRGRPRRFQRAPSRLVLEIEASDERDALDQIQRALSARPYSDFRPQRDWSPAESAISTEFAARD